MDKKIISLITVSALLISVLAVVPAVAAPSGQSVLQPTGLNCAHPSNPSNVDSGAEYLNTKNGKRLCLKNNDLGLASVSFTDGIIVKYKSDTKPFRVLKLSNKLLLNQELKKHRNDPNVEYAEPNYIATAQFAPNDPYYSYQWHLDNPTGSGIGTESAWDNSTGSGVVVAVVDTGIAYENYNEGKGKRYYKAPDLSDTCFVSGYDFVSNDSHANDDNSHGTHVAGTVAQSTNNNEGAAGVAFSACLMPVKVLDKNGSGTYANVAAGIRFAADNGAKVINLSLGGPFPSQTLEDALAYAYNKGVTIVAAAGNDSSNTLSYPAAYNDYVIAVGATRYDKTLSYYSNYGPGLDLVAPGGDTSEDQNNDGFGDGVLQNTFNPNTKNTSDFGYWFFQGTSMASPHVAGAAALVLSKGNATTPEQVREALQSTTEDLGASGWDEIYGWGLINAASALNWASGPVDNSPAVSITNPANNAVVVGAVNVTADASDDNGVVQVDFYVDGALAVSDSASPYEFSWDSTAVADGTHTLSATAVDTASQSTTSSVTVTVDNVADPVPTTAGVVSIDHKFYGGRNNNRHLNLTISVKDNLGNPVHNAAVSVKLTNTTKNTSWNYSGATNSEGVVVFTLKNAPTGCYETAVTDVSADGLTWDGATPENGLCKARFNRR